MVGWYEVVRIAKELGREIATPDEGSENTFFREKIIIYPFLLDYYESKPK